MLVVICDDSREDRETLVVYCSRYKKEKRLPISIMEFTSADDLLQSKEARKADVILMDIYIGSSSGVDAARILRKKGYHGALVFITVSQEHYKEAFEVDAAHYLTKPVEFPDFSEAMRRVQERILPHQRTLRVTSDYADLEIPVDSILYMEVYGHRTILHSVKGEMVIYQPLAVLEKMLSEGSFIRCYRSFLVNMAYVRQLSEDSFLMKDGREIPLSRDRRGEIKKEYLDYIFKKAEG